MNKVMTVADVLPHMEIDHQVVLKGMLAKAGITPDESVFEVLKKFVYTTALYKDLSFDEKKALLPLMSWDREKFAPKLNYEQRCQILAMHHSGISRDLLARAYGINRRTVTHIYNPQSTHYREVRHEMEVIGIKAFQEKYLTQDVMDRVLAYNQKRADNPEANKAANRKAGPHTVMGEHTAEAHRIVISWKTVGDQANMEGGVINQSGWYYNDLDGDFPNYWLCTGDDSLLTSEACYKAMLKDIRDKE